MHELLRPSILGLFGRLECNFNYWKSEERLNDRRIKDKTETELENVKMVEKN